MAGGFDATAFGTGLIGNLNNQIASAQKQKAQDQEFGDKQQVLAFQQAAKEYDAEKDKQSQLKSKIEDAANDIAASGNGGKGRAVSPAAYIVAKSAIEQGIYGKPEYHDYIQDGYERTYQDEQLNPDKYNIKQPAPTMYDTDSNPTQTTALNRFGMGEDLQNLENVRQHNIQSPYSGLPGSKFGNVNDFLNKQAQAKSEATAVGKDQAATSAAGVAAAQQKQDAASGVPLTAGSPQPQAAPTSAAGAAPPAQPPMGSASGAELQQSVPDHNLQPPSPAPTQAAGGAAPAAPPSSAGIQISGNAPPEQNGNMAAPANASALTPTGTQAPHGVQNAPQPIAPMKQNLNPNQLALNDNALNYYDKQRGIPMPPYMQAIIKGLANGSEDPALIFRNGKNMQLKAALTDYDPTYNDDRFRALKTFRDGQDSATQTAVNTSMEHLGLLRQAAEALNSNDTQAFNHLSMAYSQQTGQAAPTTFNDIKMYLAEEQRKIYANKSGGSEAERDAIDKSMSSAQSPAQLRGIFRSTADLLDGKINAEEYKYQNLFKGPDGKISGAYRPKDWLSPEAKQTYDMVKAYDGQGRPTFMQGTKEVPIPPQAIQQLQANPNTAPQFEAAFGRPADAYMNYQVQ